MANEQDQENELFDRLEVQVVTIIRTFDEEGRSHLDINHEGVDDDVALALVTRAMVFMGTSDDDEEEDGDDDDG